MRSNRQFLPGFPILRFIGETSNRSHVLRSRHVNAHFHSLYKNWIFVHSDRLCSCPLLLKVLRAFIHCNMANPQRVDVQDSIELQEDGGAVKSQRREFSDAAALRKAGKNPVLRVGPIQYSSYHGASSLGFSGISILCLCSASVV